jgi:hypothetical protein
MVPKGETSEYEQFGKDDSLLDNKVKWIEIKVAAEWRSIQIGSRNV